LLLVGAAAASVVGSRLRDLDRRVRLRGVGLGLLLSLSSEATDDSRELRSVVGVDWRRPRLLRVVRGVAGVFGMMKVSEVLLADVIVKLKMNRS
jgi:hypothetical protein